MSRGLLANVLCGTIIAILVVKCFSLDLNPTKTPDDDESRGYYPNYGDIPMLNRKVVKGRRVTIAEHPYVVSIRRNMAHYLTGTLLKWNTVLSVAHPIFKVPLTELAVVAGENYSDRGSRLNTVICVIFNENFNPSTLEADLALLNYYSPIPLKSVKPIEIIKMNVGHGNAFVTGWGRCDVTGKEFCLPRSSTYHRDEIHDIMLKTIQIKLEMSQYCDAYIRHGMTMMPGMLCVGTARMENLGEPCMAVPGAPLVYDGELIGVQSWGFGCGYPTDLPIIYTDVHYFSQWITATSNVLAAITSDDFRLLFDATKAAILYESLYNSRPMKLTNVQASELKTWPIDSYFKHVKGSVWDIRDFIENGKYRRYKLLAYESVKEKDAKYFTPPTTGSTDIDIVYREEDIDGISDADYHIQEKLKQHNKKGLHKHAPGEPHDDFCTDYPEPVTIPIDFDELVDELNTHTASTKSQFVDQTKEPLLFALPIFMSTNTNVVYKNEKDDVMSVVGYGDENKPDNELIASNITMQSTD